MVLNIASRILKSLLLHDLDDYFKHTFNNPEIAISPVMPFSIDESIAAQSILLTFSSEFRVFQVIIKFRHASSEEVQQLREHIESRSYETAIILSLLFKNQFTVRVSVIQTDIDDDKNKDDTLRRIDICPGGEAGDFQLLILVPINFLRLFSKSIKSDSNGDLVEAEIIGFFKNPLNIFPNLRIILETFSDIELQKLLYQLHTNKQLTEYQLCLLVLSFPDESLRLKKNLSSNVVHDVMSLMKRIMSSGKVSRRDLIGGVFSVEEAIFFLMKRGKDFGYSKFLADIQKIIETLYSIDILLLKDFGEWMDEMLENRLIYQTVSTTDDNFVVSSISENREKYLSIFEDHFSERRVKEYCAIPVESITSIERILAQSHLIANYRRLKMKRLNLGDESFEYLLRRFSRPADYNYLLFSVGWFVLSTALKGIHKKRIQTLLTHISLPARYLVEDVLRAVINPNIIHDEMQISNARRICVQAIVSLFEDGFIQLID